MLHVMTKNYILQVDVCTVEASNIGQEMIIEQEQEHNSSESVEGEPMSQC